MEAMSSGFPMRASGCLFADASAFSGLDNSLADNGVSTKLGAMAFTRMAGAHSAAKLRVNPSTAPLAAAMLL